jgi:hypothetical protein
MGIANPASASGVSATEIDARAFDAHGKFVGRKSLPYVGASAIADALWKRAKH